MDHIHTSFKRSNKIAFYLSASFCPFLDSLFFFLICDTTLIHPFICKWSNVFQFPWQPSVQALETKPMNGLTKELFMNILIFTKSYLNYLFTMKYKNTMASCCENIKPQVSHWKIYKSTKSNLFSGNVEIQKEFLNLKMPFHLFQYLNQQATMRYYCTVILHL